MGAKWSGAQGPGNEAMCGEGVSRRTVLRVFVTLVVMDFAIGLGYLAVGPLAGSYTFTERLQDVLYELFGVYGRVQWAVEGRADLGPPCLQRLELAQ